MFYKIKSILKSVGPGFIIAAVVLGPGSITVASRIGSEHGFAFLWVIFLAAVFMIVYTSMGVRFGVSNSKSILQTISDSYGRWFAIAIGISSFLSTMSFQFGNNLGIGLGMQGITGINEQIWPLIFTPSAIVLIFWAKNLYKILEKMMMVMVIIMILAFLFNVILTKPDPSLMLKGFIPGSISLEAIDVISALMATSFAVVGAMYQSYLVQDKKWKITNLKRGLYDTYMGIFFLALISALIIITSAAALHPHGITVNSAADMALQLDKLFGSNSKVVFSFGLCAAAFSSLVVNSVIGGGLLADGFGLGHSMNDKMPKIFTTVILLVGMLIAVFFRGNVIYALIMAQASSILAVPLVALGMFLILNNKKVMGAYKNNKLQNALAILGLIIIILMVYFMYSRLVDFIKSV
jgi:manganese transport protein